MKLDYRRAITANALAALLIVGGCAPAAAPPETVPPAHAPGARTLLDAHNCYPYHGEWVNRIDRALAAGTPLAIEQDLYWHTNPETGESRSILAHNEPFTGAEPGMKEYFFERIRPVVEEAIAKGDRSQWPLITLNLDFKSAEPEHLQAVWNLLGEYQPWLTTAERTADASRIMPLDVGPLLVLTGEPDGQQAAFHDAVPVGAKLRLFGAIATNRAEGIATDELRWKFQATASPEELIGGKPDNYRRWWNNSWYAVEEGGASRGGEWNERDQARLKSLVNFAHKNGLWIRFYTLNGHDPMDESSGWSPGYNFGGAEAVNLRWRAAIAAGVDFVATDQYEGFAAAARERRR
jgi:hypothetical protein